MLTELTWAFHSFYIIWAIYSGTLKSPVTVSSVDHFDAQAGADILQGAHIVVQQIS